VRRLILGTAGHIDHGKTALVRALTGVDTDRLPEEKQRGITIDLGFASLRLEDGTEIGIVDVPGHEAFIRNMLAGATGIDLALLVVAADEGVMPQTREHHAILELLGVRSVIVALTKADLVDEDWRELVAEDVRQLLRNGPFDGAAIVTVSVKSGAGLSDLVDAIARAAISVAERNQDDLFRLPIDRVFTVRGTGTVVTGTVWSGRIGRDQIVRVLPSGDELRVRAIQSHGQDRPAAPAGARAAIALAGTSRADITRGDVLVQGAGWQSSTVLAATLRLLTDSPPLRAGQRVRFHLGTSEIMGRVTPFDRRELAPGSEAWVSIRLESPVVARARDPFVLRSYSPMTTIAGGRIAEPFTARRRRDHADAATRLATVLHGRAGPAVLAALELAGWTGVRIDALPVATGLPPTDVASALASDAHIRAADFAFADNLARQAADTLLAALADHHQTAPLSPGLPREQLKQQLHDAEPAFAEWVLQHLTDEGRVHADAAGIRLAGFTPTLQPDQLAAANAILAAIEAAGLQAPAPDELPEALARRKDLLDLVHHLARAGRLVPLPQNRYLTPAALDAASRRAREALGQRADLTPADFRDLFGISRKFLIPLLEHFDRTQVTLRSGELRRLAEPRQNGSTDRG